MGKHILIVSQYFYPEQFRVNDIAIEWVKRGYKVTVVTGIPNYPQGKFYKGYSWLKMRNEEWNGVNIIRIPVVARRKNPISLIMNYLSFVVSGFIWRIGTKVRPDFVFIYEVSPMTQALVGIGMAKKRKIPCYLYVTDLWPENVEIVTGIHNKVIIGSIEKMVRKIYRDCKYIFVSSNGFVSSVEDKVENKDKVVYWPQYAEEFYKPIKRVENSPISIIQDDKFKILFAGNIGQAQGLDALVYAAKELKKTGNKKVRFIIVGDGRYKETMIKHVKDNNLQDMFDFFPKVLPDDIPKIFSLIDASLICLSQSQVFSITLPAKTQSCLACGKPIIVCASGEIQSVINNAKCGLCSEAGDYIGLASCVKKIMDMPKDELRKLGNNAVRYYEENFSKKIVLEKMDKYFCE